MPFQRELPFNELPPLPLKDSTVETVAVLRALPSARAALGELKQACLRLSNPSILISTLAVREAQGSSEIENIVTTGDELYKALADDLGREETDPNVKEVFRYKDALLYGFEQLRSGRPLSTRLFEDLVRILRNVNEGVRKVPGTKISNTKTGEIIYTPPEGEQVIREKLKQLEDFIHAESQLDPLVRLALIHYQFEAIHPFSDGNGRTGRILNLLFLLSEKPPLLTEPVLFLSRYFLQNKRKYLDSLRDVTEEGNWETWILFMIEAIRSTSLDTIRRIEAMCDLQLRVERDIQKKAPKIYSKELVLTLFELPYCKIAALEQRGIAKRQTASKYLSELVKLGILELYDTGRDKYFINRPLMEILTA